jgi:hypothetical protein
MRIMFESPAFECMGELSGPSLGKHTTGDLEQVSEGSG